VINKDKVYDVQKSSFCKEATWMSPNSCKVKIIDFGGATFDDEKHTLIINTR